MLTEREYIKQGIAFLDKMPWREKNDPEWRSGYIGNLKIQYANQIRRCLAKNLKMGDQSC